MSAVPLLIPDWPLPTGVGAAMATRIGGVSAAPYDSLNLRPPALEPPGTPADDPQAVGENIRRYGAALGAQPVFLRQVHGAQVLNLDEYASPVQCPTTADAAVTTRVGLACTVLVADCLPVLLTDVAGRAVAAAHAGWRGLAAGVLENTLQALCERAGCSPAQVQAWLGPCIGPQAFEVGPDVLQAFGHSPSAAHTAVDGVAAAAFRYAPRPDGTPRWRADLAALAGLRLRAAGLHRICSSGLCTVSEPSRFFSFRRDGLTGRMAASIWRHG